MISSLSEVFTLARQSEPVKIAIIAPEDQEFMQAVKKAQEESLIEPVLLGNPRSISRAAEKAGLDYQPGNVVEISDRQEIADRALQMLYQGDVQMVS